MAQSLFMTLKQQNPNVIIDVLTPEWSVPILERMPEVNKAIVMSLGHGRFDLKTRKLLGRELQKAHYSQSIILPNSWKSALIPWFANIPVRTGWKGEVRYFLLNDLRILNKQALPLMVQRFVSLAYDKSESYKEKNITASACPTPTIIANQNNIPYLLTKHNLATDKPVLLLCPGAEFGPAKQWPAKHYSAVAIAMIRHGWQVWIMGSAADKAIADDITSTVKNRDISNLCGETSLEEAVDLMSLASHVVSNDSGLMHIASALNRPLIALYGATSPKFTPPLSRTADVLSIEVDCGPCFKRQCPEKHHACMQNLTPDKVIAILSSQ